MSDKNKDSILIINMFSGKYASEKIAHEVLNVFRTDKDSSGKPHRYLYAPPDGHMPHDDIKKVLMVRYLGSGKYQVVGRGIVDHVIADETNPELLKKMRYGSVSISSIFNVADQPFKLTKREPIKENGKDTGKTKEVKNEEITFELSVCERPKEQVIITCLPKYEEKESDIAKGEIYINMADKYHGPSEKDQPENGEVIVDAGSNTDKKGQRLALLVQRQRRYIEKASDCENAPYYELNKLFDRNKDNNPLEWTDFPTVDSYISENESKTSNARFLTLINKENDELSYSNMLAYFLNEDEELSQRFIRFLSKKAEKEIKETELIALDIAREKMHIDILIETKTSLFVIENKVNAKLDEDKNTLGKEYDSNIHKLQANEKFAGGQLQRYIDNLQKHNKAAGITKNLFVFVLCPSRNELFQEYKNYTESDGSSGLLRKVIIEDPKAPSGMKLSPVPVITYEEILSILSGVDNYTPEMKLFEKMHCTPLKNRYFRDFLDMLYWQENPPSYADNTQIMDRCMKRFIRAIRLAKAIDA